MNRKIKSILLSFVSFCFAFLMAWSGSIFPSQSLAQAAPFSNSNDLRMAPSDISDNIEGKGFPEVRTDDLTQQNTEGVKHRAKELADGNKRQIKNARNEIQSQAKQAAGNVKNAVEDTASKVEATKDNAVGAVKDFFNR
jgi:ribosome recycling factor